MQGITGEVGERCITTDQKREVRVMFRRHAINKKQWCKNNKVSYGTLMRLIDVRDDYGTDGMIQDPGAHILRLLREQGFLR